MPTVREDIWITSSLLGFFLSILMTTLLHGDVALASLYPYALVYSLASFSYFYYEIYKAYLCTEGNSSYLRFGSLVGTCVRIPYLIVGLATEYGIWFFATVTSLDFACRGLYYYRCSLKIEKHSEPECTKDLGCN